MLRFSKACRQRSCAYLRARIPRASCGSAWLRMRTQQIADTNLRQNVARVRRIGLNLAPHPIDVDLQHVRLADIVWSPHVFEELVLGEHSSGILREIGEQAIFYRRQVEILIPQPRLTWVEIHA